MHPQWYYTLRANPAGVIIQDGPAQSPVVVPEAHGAEREQWWLRAVAAFPPYAEYQQRTQRVIPVLIAIPARRGGGATRPEG